jgi:hypothetical protein
MGKKILVRSEISAELAKSIDSIATPYGIAIEQFKDSLAENVFVTRAVFLARIERAKNFLVSLTRTQEQLSFVTTRKVSNTIDTCVKLGKKEEDLKGFALYEQKAVNAVEDALSQHIKDITLIINEAEKRIC